MDRKTIGRLGEEYAAAQLEKEGWKIVERNFCCRYGEMDIIARKEDVLAFAEVKTRRSGSLYRPYEAVNYGKQQRLIRIAQFYLMEHETQASPRFDVIEVLIRPGEGFAVESWHHIESAFTL